MPLTQAEADSLLGVTKSFADASPLQLTQTLPMDFRRELLSVDLRERFFMDVRRSPHVVARLRYQTRARVSVILARLEIDGPRHRNPPSDGEENGQWIGGTHLHVYREGLGDRFAYPEEQLEELGFTLPLELVPSFRGFLRFCSVSDVPDIQLEI